jgi:hypothetical protein
VIKTKNANDGIWILNEAIVAACVGGCICLAGSTIVKHSREKEKRQPPAVPYIVSWTRPKLFLRDLIHRGEREGRKIEAVRDKIQFKVEKNNHAM